MDVIAELKFQAQEPPAGDERIAQFCSSMLTLATKDPPSALAIELLDAQADRSPSYAVNHILRVLQKQYMTHEPDYPVAYASESSWLAAFMRLEAEPDRIEVARHDMTRSVQSNIVERYKAFKTVMQLFPQYTGAAPRLLDVGCSRNHGLKKLKLNLPFQPVGFGEHHESRGSHALLDLLVKYTMRQTIALGPAIGADIVPYGHGDDAAWARSCSFYPSELLSSGAVSQYDYLDTNEFEGVAFTAADFAGDGLPIEHREKEFDVITASTFMYQLSHGQRARARKLFRNSLSKTGMIIYQDFVAPSEDGKNLVFAKQWFNKPYPYRTLVELGSDPEHRVHEVLRWDTGRCNNWIIGKDLDALINKQ